jgi:endonuclease VIII
MPEGDNVHAHAIELQALIGVPLTGVMSGAIDRRALIGQHITTVEAVGKHLLIGFSEGAAVRVHLGITGRWRRLRGTVSREMMARASLALATQERTYLCERARTIEWSRARLMRGARALANVGPDLIGDFDLDAVMARARHAKHAARAIGEALLDQSICSGIGNVYKSELCFLHGIDPWRRVEDVDDATLRAIYVDAARLLRMNVGHTRTTTGDPRFGPRRSSGKGRLWVYGRARRACYKCGTPIVHQMQLPSLRPTYFCPTCQPRQISPGAVRQP